MTCFCVHVHTDTRTRDVRYPRAPLRVLPYCDNAQSGVLTSCTHQAWAAGPHVAWCALCCNASWAAEQSVAWCMCTHPEDLPVFQHNRQSLLLSQVCLPLSLVTLTVKPLKLLERCEVLGLCTHTHTHTHVCQIHASSYTGATTRAWKCLCS